MPPAALPIDLPDVHAEVYELFLRYEAALLRNDLAALDEFFWPSDAAVRYGLREHSYGFAAICADRAKAQPVHPQRALQRTVVTTFGRDAASVCAEFGSPGSTRVGRQTQTWIRFPDGWRIVAAHVSTVDAGELAQAHRPRS